MCHLLDEKKKEKKVDPTHKDSLFAKVITTSDMMRLSHLIFVTNYSQYPTCCIVSFLFI